MNSLREAKLIGSTNIFLCSSPLQVVHAHLVRKQYLAHARNCFLLCEPPINAQLVRLEMWDDFTKLENSRRGVGNAPRAIATNLTRILEKISNVRQESVHLL